MTVTLISLIKDRTLQFCFFHGLSQEVPRPAADVSAFGRYMPKKPTKWGMKVIWAGFSTLPNTRFSSFFLRFRIWALCDPFTGYLSKFEVYQGKRRKSAEKNVGEKVVLRLSAHLPAGTCIAAGRFFGTLALVMRLIDCGKWFIGTVMGNSEGLPAEMNRGKSSKGAERGQSVARYIVYKGVQIWTTLWYDTKPVNLLHTIGSPASYSGTAMRWVKNTAGSGFKRVTYWCPSAYIIYNQMMGGVDTFDHYRAMYTVSLIVKSRWTVYLFMWTVEAAICNAYILYSQNPNVPKLSHSQFLLGRIRAHGGPGQRSPGPPHPPPGWNAEDVELRGRTTTTEKLSFVLVASN